MFRKEYLTICLISLLFTFSLLVVIPQIPIVVDNPYYKIDSFIGGYSFILPSGKLLDLKQFKTGLDVGGGTKVIFQAGISSPDEAEKTIQSLLAIFKNRMDQSGYYDYEVGVENISEKKVYVSLPNYVQTDYIKGLLTGSGRLVMKKLKDPGAWKIENAPEIINEPTSWVNSDLTEQDILNILISKDASTGKTQMQLLLSVAGKQKFANLVKENVNKPIGIFVNDSQYPFAVPVISQNLADSPGADPIITGTMPVEALKELILQMKTGPLPVLVTFVETTSVGSTLGTNFIYNYGIALLAALLLIFSLFIIKFRLLGVVYNWSLMVSLIVFSAVSKLVSLVVNVPSIIGVLIFLFMLTDVGYLLLKKLKVEKSDEKPFDLALFQTFEKYKGSVVAIGILTVVAAFVIMNFSSGEIKSFSVALSIGMFSLLLNYFLISRNLLDIFGRKNK